MSSFGSAEPFSRKNPLGRLACAVGGGAVAGLAAFGFARALGSQAGTDVVIAFPVGIGCLAAGIVLSYRPAGGPFRSIVVALLLGTGIAWSILGAFWYLQDEVFGYRAYPDLNYILGEVAGYSGPGIGLLTCGTVLIFTCLRPRVDVQPAKKHVGAKFFLRLVTGLILGVGAGLLNAALAYVSLTVLYLNAGKMGSTSDVAGYMATGQSFLMTGVALHLLFRSADPIWLRRTAVGLLLLTGLSICAVGVYRWLN